MFGMMHPMMMMDMCGRGCGDDRGRKMDMPLIMVAPLINLFLSHPETIEFCDSYTLLMLDDKTVFFLVDNLPKNVLKKTKFLDKFIGNFGVDGWKELVKRDKSYLQKIPWDSFDSDELNLMIEAFPRNVKWSKIGDGVLESIYDNNVKHVKKMGMKKRKSKNLWAKVLMHYPEMIKDCPKEVLEEGFDLNNTVSIVTSQPSLTKYVINLDKRTKCGSWNHVRDALANDEVRKEFPWDKMKIDDWCAYFQTVHDNYYPYEEEIVKKCPITKFNETQQKKLIKALNNEGCQQLLINKIKDKRIDKQLESAK